MRRELERLDVPGEHDARERAWALVQAAYANRERVPRRRPVVRPVIAVAVLAAVVAAAISPPGRAVIDSVRKVVGVERSDEAILGLPAPGRILVNATTGPWIVGEDGSRRALGRYDQAAWSPQGRFVVATRGRELFALTPRGDVRWAHAQAGLVDFPRWSPSGFRIAYQTGSTLRVIAGDGTDERVIGRGAAYVAAAWRPGDRHVLAFADSHRSVTVVDTDSRRRLWRTLVPGPMVQLAWAPDASRLLVLHEHGYVLLGRRGGVLSKRSLAGASTPFAVFAPRGHRFALALSRPGRSELRVDDRVLFAGPGGFNDLEWSPDGRWVLVSWGSANQWVFVRADGVRRIAAISNVSQQFRSRQMPALAGWCCA